MYLQNNYIAIDLAVWWMNLVDYIAIDLVVTDNQKVDVYKHRIL